MKDEREVNDAAERAADMQDAARKAGRSQYPNMAFEDGVREALDWVVGNVDEDPTDETEGA